MMFGRVAYVENALDGDDNIEARIRWCVAELQDDKKRSLEAVVHECEHWISRLEHYVKFCNTLIEDPSMTCGFSSNGEVQGNTYSLDVLFSRIYTIEKTIEGLKKNLLPDDKKPLVTATLRKKTKK